MPRIGTHFTYSEMTTTSTGLPNTPDDEQLIHLTRLVALVLDPLREAMGPLRITSGFRSEAVNKKVGGSPRSYHRHGLAADLKSSQWTPHQLAREVDMLNLPYDKAISEFGSWLHIQMAAPGTEPRKQLLTAKKVNGKTEYQEGLT